MEDGLSGGAVAWDKQLPMGTLSVPVRMRNIVTGEYLLWHPVRMLCRHRIMSCRVVSCRVVSCRVVSCRVVSCRVVSCRVVS